MNIIIEILKAIKDKENAFIECGARFEYNELIEELQRILNTYSSALCSIKWDDIK